MKRNTTAFLHRSTSGLLLVAAFLCIGLTTDAEAAVQTSIASGFTSPATLTPNSAGGPVTDDFNGTALDTCVWDLRPQGSLSEVVSGGSLTYTANASEGDHMFGFLANNYDASEYEIGITLSATSGGFSFSFGTEDYDGPGGGLEDSMVVHIQQDDNPPPCGSSARCSRSLPRPQPR